MEIAAPAAPTVGSLDPVASQVTTQSDDPKTTPQADKPAGTPQAETPAGSETAAKPESEEDDGDQPKTWKEKRQERNRARWQEFKEAKAIVRDRISTLEAEVTRLRSARPPDLSQVTDPQEELAQRTAWAVRQQQAADSEERLTAERQRAGEDQGRKMFAAWNEAVAEAKTRIPDFDQVVTDNTKIHARMAPLIVESEKGTDIAYWLGKNPDKAAELFDQFERGSPQAYLELGRLEARLSAPTPKTLSTAPKPAPVLGGGANPLQFDAERASPDDMAAQLRKAGLIR